MLSLKIDLNLSGNIPWELSDEQIIAVTERNMSGPNVSRQALEAEMIKVGVNADFFKSLTVDQLSDLLFGLNKVANSKGSSLTQSQNAKKVVVLTSIDKKILKALLESKGNPSSIQLSRDLDVPLSTIQRRRKRLEEEFVKESYSLKYEKFGRRQVTFIAMLGAADKSEVANQILSLEKVISVSRTFGDGADLKVEAIIETNQDFMQLSEKIKSIPGIQKLCWFESLEVMGQKNGLDLSIIESI
jgi:DNA-binding Lrp family transcriptional regulator